MTVEVRWHTYLIDQAARQFSDSSNDLAGKQLYIIDDDPCTCAHCFRRLAVINKIGDVSLFGARKPIARQFQGLPNSEQIILRLTHFTRGSWPVGCRQQPNSEGAMEDHAA